MNRWNFEHSGAFTSSLSENLKQFPTNPKTSQANTSFKLTSQLTS